MQRSAILVAGGLGKRMGSSIPKQFMLLKGKPLLCWTIEAFRAYDNDLPIIVVLPEPQIPIWKSLCIGHNFITEHTVVAGGAERYHSVQNGLAHVDHNGLVAVHDGVRPLISSALIGRCFTAAETHGSAIPVISISSSVRMVKGDENHAMDRSQLRAVQTPQCFQVELLRKAFELPFDPSFTDEATLVERLGIPIYMVEGEETNLKVTTPFDLRIAEQLNGEPSPN